jgi:hypothetical protein
MRFELGRIVLMLLKHGLQCGFSIRDVKVARRHPPIGSPQKVLSFAVVKTEPTVVGRVMVPDSIGRKSHIFERKETLLLHVDSLILNFLSLDCGTRTAFCRTHGR